MMMSGKIRLMWGKMILSISLRMSLVAGVQDDLLGYYLEAGN